MSGSERVRHSLVESTREPFSFHERLAPVFADEICLQIVAELNRRKMSPKQFHREFHRKLGAPNISAIYRRFNRLKEIGWLGKVGEEKRRGVTEHFYAATGPAIRDTAVLADISDSLRRTDNGKALEQLYCQLKEAMKVGTFDARKDRYFAWVLLSLDQQGWQKVIAGIEKLAGFLADEEVRAKNRMTASGEKPIKMTAGLAAFEAPKGVLKAH
jgi:hypothetical protein